MKACLKIDGNSKFLFQNLPKQLLTSFFLKILSCSLDLFFINFYNIDFKLLRDFKLSSYYFYQLHLNRFLGSIHLMLFSLNKSFIFSLLHFLFTIFLVKEFGKYHVPNLSIQIYQISLWYIYQIYQICSNLYRIIRFIVHQMKAEKFVCTLTI